MDQANLAKSQVHGLSEVQEHENVEIVNGEVHVRYPFKRDPRCLPNNRHIVLKIAGKLWERLKKDNLLADYNAEVKKYIDRGTFVELTDDEISSYQGPAQYITHHGVLKDSASTPLRVVTNSSFKNGTFSLNCLLPKGPNSLNDMLEVTVRFRAYEKVFAFDLAKAYNTMRTGIVE